jgi:hypothetical protein
MDGQKLELEGAANPALYGDLWPRLLADNLFKTEQRFWSFSVAELVLVFLLSRLPLTYLPTKPRAPLRADFAQDAPLRAHLGRFADTARASWSA